MHQAVHLVSHCVACVAGQMVELLPLRLNAIVVVSHTCVKIGRRVACTGKDKISYNYLVSVMQLKILVTLKVMSACSRN